MSSLEKVKDLHLLFIEETPEDYVRILNVLNTEGFNIISERVCTPACLEKALANPVWDAILSAFSIPDFNGFQVLELTRKSQREIPFILIDEEIGEDMAVAILKAGADDYVKKSNLDVLGCRLSWIIEDYERRKREKLILAEQSQAFEHMERLVASRTAELEKAYKDLKHKEERLQNAQRMAQLGYYEHNMKERQVYWSEKLYAIFGYQPGEIEPDIQVVLDHVHPEDLAWFQQNVTETFRMKTSYKCIYRIVRKDGEIRYLDSQGEWTFNNDNEPEKLSGIVLDFTERKQSEHAMNLLIAENEALLSNIPDLAWMKDKHSRFIAVNEAFAKTVNFKREAIVGKCDLDLWPEDLALKYAADDQRVMKSGQCHSFEEMLMNPDGTRTHIETIKTPIRDEKGQVIGTVGIARDISMRKEMEEFLLKSQEQLEEKVKERTIELERANTDLKAHQQLRGNFISALTHDLRTPLIAQKRLIELLPEQDLSDRRRIELLCTGLSENNEHLLDMVQKLLESYQLEEGGIQLEIEPIHLSALVENSMAALQEIAKKKNILLINDISKNLAPLQADPVLLKRVFINLIGNACENIGTGNHVTITARDDGQNVEIQVIDDGPGIQPDILPNLFDRYFTRSLTRPRIGAGLGLFICRMIVELHGGAITVHSEVGKGAAFTIVLPKQPVQGKTREF